MKQRIYTQFELPRTHLSERGPHYTLPAGVPIDEIYRRQARGLAVTAAVAEELQAHDVDDGNFTTQVLAMGAINSAWYTYAARDERIRRVTRLPELANDKKEWHQSRSGLLTRIEGEARGVTGRPLDDVERFALGKKLVHTSLSLACLDVVQTTQSYDEASAQLAARERCADLLAEARDAAIDYGAYPSLAQVGQEASELMLGVRRRAPRESVALFDRAIERVDALVE